MDVLEVLKSIKSQKIGRDSLDDYMERLIRPKIKTKIDLSNYISKEELDILKSLRNSLYYLIKTIMSIKNSMNHYIESLSNIGFIYIISNGKSESSFSLSNREKILYEIDKIFKELENTYLSSVNSYLEAFARVYYRN